MQKLYERSGFVGEREFWWKSSYDVLFLYKTSGKHYYLKLKKYWIITCNKYININNNNIFQVDYEDKLPKQFCYDCTIKIESAFTFVKEAQENDIKFKNIILRPNTGVIVESQTKNNIELSNCNTFDDEYVENSTCVYENEIILRTEAENNIANECANNIKSNFQVNEKLQDEKRNNDLSNDKCKRNVCVKCEKSFSTRTWYTKHMKKEHAESEYSCTQCSKS